MIRTQPRLETLDGLSEIIEHAGNGADIIEQVEQGVQTFDAMFGKDPLVNEYRSLGLTAHGVFNGTDMALEAVQISEMIYGIMDQERKLRPAAYKRSDVVTKIQLALTLCDVPSSVSVNQLIPLRWLVMLDKSIVAEDGLSRSFVGEPTEPAWFGGNITLYSLRMLAALIHRESGKDELDVWTFDVGHPNLSWEPFVRESVVRLRRGELSARMLKARIDHRKSMIEKMLKDDAERTLSNKQRDDLETKRLHDAEEKKRADLRKKIGEVQEYAIKELGYDKDKLQTVMVATGAIPPAPRSTTRSSPSR